MPLDDPTPEIDELASIYEETTHMRVDFPVPAILPISVVLNIHYSFSLTGTPKPEDPTVCFFFR